MRERMTIREMCRRIREIHRTSNGFNADHEERMDERERLCIALGDHRRTCHAKGCWCNKDYREWADA